MVTQHPHAQQLVVQPTINNWIHQNILQRTVTHLHTQSQCTSPKQVQELSNAQLEWESLF